MHTCTHAHLSIIRLWNQHLLCSIYLNHRFYDKERRQAIFATSLGISELCAERRAFTTPLTGKLICAEDTEAFPVTFHKKEDLCVIFKVKCAKSTVLDELSAEEWPLSAVNNWLLWRLALTPYSDLRWLCPLVARSLAQFAYILWGWVSSDERGKGWLRLGEISFQVYSSLSCDLEISMITASGRKQRNSRNLLEKKFFSQKLNLKKSLRVK